MTAPPPSIIDLALHEAAHSPCRSKRGVVIYDPADGRPRGAGFNGPPGILTCPGREVCAGKCGKMSVHAEVRALREAAASLARDRYGGRLDLVHVERDPDGGMLPCDGPSCWQCSREILDVGFISGVWLYERDYTVATPTPAGEPWPALRDASRWVYYPALRFHIVTLQRALESP